jgi:hypothetical protein
MDGNTMADNTKKTQPEQVPNRKLLLAIHVYKLQTDNNLPSKLLSDLGEVAKGISEMKVNDANSITTGVKTAYEGMKKFTTELSDTVLTKDFTKDVDLHKTLYFPFPEDITETTAQSFEKNTLNLEAQLAKGLIGKAINKASTIYGPSGVVLENIRDYVEHSLKRANILVDPNILMTYEGPVPRSFSLRFNIIPQNQKEAEMYLKNINELRNYSLALRKNVSISQDMKNMGIKILEQDHVFAFEAKYNTALSKENYTFNYLNLLLGTGKDMITHNNGGFYIENLSITNGSQAISTFYDGMPKILNITIDFVERKPLWRKDWEAHRNKYKTILHSEDKKTAKGK